MKKILLALLLCFVSSFANAQTASQLYYKSGNNQIPVSSSSPLPIGVFDSTNHSGYCYTSNGSSSSATFQPCGSSGSSILLGTSTSATNPHISGDLTTGLFTSGASKIDFSISGVNRGEFSSSGLYLPVPLAPLSGGISLTDSGISTATGNNATPLQSAINTLVTNATNANTTLGQPGFQIAEGVYSFTTGVTSRPWIKLEPFGSVEFDFSGMSSSGTALRVYNQDSPTADFTNRNTSNRAAFLGGDNGSFLVWGPGKATSSVGVDLGNSSPASDVSVRESSMRNFHIMHFGTGLFMRNIDNYVTNFQHFNIEGNTTCIATETGLNSNSGERLSFEDGICAGSTEGYEVNTDAFDTLFHNVSWDFITGPALLLNAGNGYGKIEFSSNHFEAINKPVLSSLFSTASNEVVFIHNSKWVTTQNSPLRNAPDGYFASGPMNLYVDGLYIGGYGTTSNAAEGMFMFDCGTVTLKKVDNIYFNAWKQMLCSTNLLVNDPYFSAGTVNADLATDTAANWTKGTSNLITAITDSVANGGVVWTAGGATQSIKFTSSNASGSFYTIKSDWFKVKAGQRLLADIAFYGGTSAGTGGTGLRYYFRKTDGTVTNDGVSSGDSMTTIYGQTSDPAYTGNRLWWAKPNNLRETTVPQGYEWAQLEVTVSAFLGDMWLGFAGINSLSGG